MTAVRVQDVKRCARCGKDHNELEFSEFQRPSRVEAWGEAQVKFWTMCPTTGEPIFLLVWPIEER